MPQPLRTEPLSAASVLAICPACHVSPARYHTSTRHAGVLECDACGEWSLNGQHVSSCYDCAKLIVLDASLYEVDDGNDRCWSCGEERETTVARQRAEDRRFSLREAVEESRL